MDNPLVRKLCFGSSNVTNISPQKKKDIIEYFNETFIFYQILKPILVSLSDHQHYLYCYKLIWRVVITVDPVSTRWLVLIQASSIKHLPNHSSELGMTVVKLTPPLVMMAVYGVNCDALQQ